MAEVAGNYAGFDYDYERQTRTIEPEKKGSVNSDPKEDKIATERDSGNPALAFQVPGTNNSSLQTNQDTKSSSAPNVNQAWGAFGGSIRLPGGAVIPNPAALAIGNVDPSAENNSTFKVPTAGAGVQSDNANRDSSEASKHLLDGQIDALGKDKNGEFNLTGNAFINYKGKDGQEYLAFKSDFNGPGDTRYGQRKIDENGKFSGDWENITDQRLKDKLDNAHSTQMYDVSNHGGIANFREAESLRKDITEFKDFDFSENSEALGKLNGITTELDKLRNGEKIDPNQLRTDFNALLDSNKDLKTAYLDNRISDLEKMNSGLDVAALKASVADTDKPISDLKGIIDTAIDSHRDENQKIAGQDLEKLNGNMSDLEKNIAKLQNAGADPETIKSLTDAYNNLKASPNAQGKYKLEESNYLNSRINSLINPSQQQPIEPSVPEQPGHEGHNHGPSPDSNPNFEQPEPQKPRGGGGHWHGGTYHEGSH